MSVKSLPSLVAEIILVGTGTVLTFYVAAASLGFMSNSSVHYATFILAILILCSIITISTKVMGVTYNSFDLLRKAVLILPCAGAVFGAAYLRFNALRIELSAPNFTDGDLIFGSVMLLGILGLTWIHWGGLLACMIIAVVTYFFLGHHVPHPLLMHPEYDIEFIMNYIGLGLTDGIFWLSQIAADSLYLLVIYAAVLLGTGMLPLVVELGKYPGNRVRGGAAFPAVIGSAIVGTVMGQGTANVMLTGRFTIPAMVNAGFRKEMAGAIEAVASLSGQILPPILGLAGFIIASTLNRAYIEIALGALIPGLLFLSGLVIGIIVYAYRSGVPRTEARVNTDIIKRLMPTFVLSFGVLFYLLLTYSSPAIAALAAIVVALISAFLFQGKYRPSLSSMYAAYKEGLVTISILSLLLIAIGPLAQTFLTTNVASRAAILLVNALPEYQFIMLVLAMLVALILGLGLPTPAAYLIGALTAVPLLQGVGVGALEAHFFVFYFAVFSALSPPIAVAAMAASKVADAPFLDTAIAGLKLMCPMLIIPYAFISIPGILTFPDISWEVAVNVVALVLLQIILVTTIFGYASRRLTFIERCCIGGLGLVGAVFLYNQDIFFAYAFIASAILFLSYIIKFPKNE